MADNNKQAKEAIKAYLDERAASDQQFAANYAKKNKNLDECFQYILGEARKRGNAVCMTDAEVFGLAVHYYDEDDVKIDRSARASVSTSRNVPPAELTEEEKKAAKERAVEMYQQQCIREMKERDAKRKPKAPAAQEGVIVRSLFDFEEEEA